MCSPTASCILLLKPQATKSNKMSAIRSVRPRVCRPNLSPRYQCLRRNESSSSLPAVSPAANASVRPASRTFTQRNRWPIAFSTLALIFGLGAGNFVANYIAPPLMPKAGSHGDGVLMADLNRRLDEEFKVKVLRGKCLGVAKQLRGEEGGWVEILPSVERSTAGMIGNLQGAKGLGAERVFWDRGNKTLVAVIWYGSSVSGWPGVTHGGLIATTMSDKLALAAALCRRGGEDEISSAAIPQRMPGTGNHAKMFAPSVVPVEPMELNIAYKKPTYANNFYTIRVQPHYPTNEDGISSRSNQHFEATLEQMDAKVNVIAIGTFGPGSKAEAMERQLVGGAKQSYAEFKQWLWPSRQKASVA
nr:putative mitochondrial membrane protein fmp10 [Quercus suber]